MNALFFQPRRLCWGFFIYFCLNSFCIGLGKRVFDHVRGPFFIGQKKIIKK